MNQKRKSEVDKILQLQKKISQLSDDELKAKTEEFRKKPVKDIKLEAFAVVKEAAKRVIGLDAFPVQLMGALALYDGKVVEMKTGEGKTLVSIFPAYVRALEEKGVHIVTVNEYLAQRDAEWMGQVLEFLGLSVGVSLNDMSSIDKRNAYSCDVTYVTNTEIGFDYLRGFLGTKTLRSENALHYCIIDEVDSILIDEARTPLIISDENEEGEQLFISAKVLAERLVRGTGETELSKIDAISGILPDEDGDYLINEKDKAVILTEDGVSKIEKYFGIDNYSTPENVKYQHHVVTAIKAKELMHKDKDYIVDRGTIQIVDEFTGRILQDRRYSDGLHEAIEAKEGVEVQDQTKTAAKITYQSLFNLYDRKAGMSGTVYKDRKEFKEIYHLKVERIPTNKPVIRVDHNDQIYATKKAKENAIIERVKGIHELHRPVLIGTTSVQMSERISDLLTKEGLVHEVLNAKNHLKEAEIIAKAGQIDAITVATNMAGRGTDILLGDGVADLGGLYVIGCGKHEARRIDDQLRGRAGRQGDPGESMFFVSLEDDFMKQYGNSELSSKILENETEELNNKTMRNHVLKTQKKIEQNYYGIRKNLFDYDKIDNLQFEAVIDAKSKVLNQFSVAGLFYQIIDMMCKSFDYDKLAKRLPLQDLHITKEDVEQKKAARKLKDFLKGSLENDNEEGMITQRLKSCLAYAIISEWTEHIQKVEDLQKVSRYQGLGKNPLDYYKIQGYRLFEQTINEMKYKAVETYFAF